MGADSIRSKYNQEHEVTLEVILNKVCYFPSEIISGYLDIKPKYNLNQTIFNETKTIFKLTQFQSYLNPNGDSSIKVEENSDIINFETYYNYFCGANILLGIKIPFSFEIPLRIQPTFYFKTYYIRHYFCVELPGIKAKRALIIIIKSFQFFNLENKLLKMPAFGFGDFYKYQNGRISCLLELQKNSFTYSESIPLKINFKCSESKLAVKSLTIKIEQYVYLNEKENHKKHYLTVLKKDLISKEIFIKEILNNYEIKDIIILPHNINNCQEVYSILESNKKIEVDYQFGNLKKDLIPFCIGGLISCEFLLRVKIKYKFSDLDDSFVLPIELMDYDFNPLNKINNNKQNNNNDYNINFIDDYDKYYNNKGKVDFELIEHEDFQKAFYENKN